MTRTYRIKLRHRGGARSTFVAHIRDDESLYDVVRPHLSGGATWSFSTQCMGYSRTGAIPGVGGPRCQRFVPEGLEYCHAHDPERRR